MEARELKDKATQLFNKGRFAKAAETYEEFCVLDKKDHQARLRCGDAWSKAGKKDKAIQAYSMAAEGYAKDGFLPRAIAASKLVLEIDPAHKGVQKMLAELYAQKSGGARSGGGSGRPSSPSAIAAPPAPATAANAAPDEIEITRNVSTPVTSSFVNNKNAIDLDAPVARPAAKKGFTPTKTEAPSPMNRADALELPEYEIPMDDGPSSVGGMSAQRGPSPQRRADAIEIEVDDGPERGPKALIETTIDIDMGGGQAVSGEIEIPIEGQPLPESEQPPLAGIDLPPPPPGPQSFELAIDVPAAAPASGVYDLTDTVPEPRPSVPVFELTEVADPPPPAPPPAVQSVVAPAVAPAAEDPVAAQLAAESVAAQAEAEAAQRAAAQVAAAQVAAAQVAAAQAAAAQAAAAQVAAAQAAAAQAAAAQAAAAEAAAAEAAAAQAAAAQAAAAQAAAAQVAAAQAAAAQAAVAQSAVAQSAVAQSGAAQSGAAQSGAAQSGAAQSGAAQSGAAQSGAAQSGAAQSVAAQSSAVHSGAGQSAADQSVVAPPLASQPVAAPAQALGTAASRPSALPPSVGDAASAPPSIKPLQPVEATQPPGLKPRRTETAPAGATAPSSSRIWLPPTFTPAVTRTEPSASPATASTSPIPAPAEPATDLERSLQAFMQFDPDAPAAPAPAPVKAAPSFTELDLDESDSLLHAVEAASSAASAPVEEAMEAEAHPEPGGLPKIPLFSDLPEDAFIALFEKCPLQRFEEGQIVFEQGEKADAFYVICGGQVRVFRTDGGARKDLATLEEGSFFGEMALLSEAPRSASVEAAAEDTQVLVISAEILKELSASYPVVSSALKKFCRQRMLSNLMNQAAIFAPFNRNDRRDLVQKFRARDVAKGDVLVKEGTASDGLYVVLSGEVEVEAKGTRIATLKEGQVFGEMSLLMRSPASATVRALRHTSLLRLPKHDFDMLILSHPQVLEHVSSLIDERKKSDLSRKKNDAAEIV